MTTTDHFDPRASADALLQAWHSGERLQQLPPSIRPSTLAQGYAVQDAFFAASGGKRQGWKLGVGSPAQLRATGLSRPLIGQLEQSRLLASGASVVLPADDAVKIECEIAFVLARDLPPRSGYRVEPADILHTCITFEVVRSRFADIQAVGWPSFVADNVGFEALVIGNPLSDGMEPELLERINEDLIVRAGDITARPLSGDAAIDPLRSMEALLDHAGERGLTLRAGDIVTTGTICKPFDLVGNHTVTATFLDQRLEMHL